MKLTKIGALVAVGMLAFSACTTGPGGATPPADELGVITIPPGEPVKIAYWGVLSGADASLGQDGLTGAQVALDDKGGTFMEHPLQLAPVEDGLCTVEGGAAAAQKMASDTTIVALVGSSCSDETEGGIKSLTDAGLTTISGSNTRPSLTAPDRTADYAGYLRTAHSDAFQGRAVAEFVFNELGLTTAATLHDGSAYAEALQQVFADEFIALGGEIVIQEQVGRDTTDMTPVLTRVAGASPEVLYYPIFVAAGGFVTAQAGDVPGLEDAVLIGSDGMFTPDFVTAAGPAAEGMYLSSPNFSAFQAGYADFLPKYEAKAGSAPVAAFHAHAYDAFNIIYAALEKVTINAPDGTLFIPKKALRDAIFATTGHQGLTGVLACSPSGDCGAPLIAMYQITQAEIGGTWPPAAPVWPE